MSIVLTGYRSIACLLLLLPAACGGSSPSAPSSASSAGGAAINVSGSWAEPGGTLTMQLQQTGGVVTGTSGFLDRNAVFGSYEGNGTVSGTVAGAVLTLSEVYQLKASGEPMAGCVETVTSTFTIQSETQMSGPFTQTDTCNGTVVFSKNGASTIVKQ